MLMILILMQCVTYAGITTIMFIVSGIINLIVTIFGDAQLIRFGTFLASICNIIAFIIIGSYASVLGESLCGIIGIWSFKLHKNKEVIKWGDRWSTEENLFTKEEI